jgi:hypothetical protein
VEPKRRLDVDDEVDRVADELPLVSREVVLGLLSVQRPVEQFAGTPLRDAFCRRLSEYLEGCCSGHTPSYVTVNITDRPVAAARDARRKRSDARRVRG